MEFFDSNLSYGMSILSRELKPVHTIQGAADEMQRAGIKRAIVWRVEQAAGNIVEANELLAQDIAGYNNLYGVWTILPSHTHEIPAPHIMPEIMKKKGIIGWRLCPDHGRYLTKPFVLKDWYETAVARKIPIFVNTGHGMTLEALADILTAYPDLTVVLTYDNCWPNDRMLRPFFATFANLYLDMTHWFIDGGIESFVGAYGASRLLYGSGFPHAYLGANMLMIKHAAISDEDKAAIAGRNMMRIVEEVVL